jgi:hypothetical protein
MMNREHLDFEVGRFALYTPDELPSRVQRLIVNSANLLA